MIFDTDILIWVQRGSAGAVDALESTPRKYISIQTYMELLQCSPTKRHLAISKAFIEDFKIEILPLTESISHRAATYIEEYSLSTGIRTGDALIGATAVEHGSPLFTGNEKHFRSIKAIQLTIFRPE